VNSGKFPEATNSIPPTWVVRRATGELRFPWPQKAIMALIPSEKLVVARSQLYQRKMKLPNILHSIIWKTTLDSPKSNHCGWQLGKFEDSSWKRVSQQPLSWYSHIYWYCKIILRTAYFELLQWINIATCNWNLNHCDCESSIATINRSEYILFVGMFLLNGGYWFANSIGLLDTLLILVLQ